MNELKYRIADFLFAKELDEAYEMGIRIGAEYAARTISFKVGVTEVKKNLTKTQAQGYAIADGIIQDCKQDIANTTGAML